MNKKRKKMADGDTDVRSLWSSGRNHIDLDEYALEGSIQHSIQFQWWNISHNSTTAQQRSWSY